MQKNLLSILRLSQTVFSFKELLLLWGEQNVNAAKTRLHYYVRSGQLHRIRRGFYAKDQHYDSMEFATKLYAPAYISFETVLAEAGVIFQGYTAIFVAAACHKNIGCDGRQYAFRKIQDSILMNTFGLEERKHYFIASKERAFLDTLYLNKNYHFDNLAPLDPQKIQQLLPLYHNQRMQKQVDETFKK